jgi:chloramphenicol 3-O-phosphotransferase
VADLVRVLLLTGTVGAGKTTIALEINDVLAELDVPNAAIDLDGLTAQWPPSSKWNADLMFDNLAVLWPNYSARGVTHLVLAHVLEDGTELERYREAVPGATVIVVRLVSTHATRVARLLSRMPAGPSRDWHLHRTGELEEILEAAAHEDFVVDNGDRPVREVALEILRRAAWI